LAEADRRKTEFVAMLAHELRNPLAPIRNALEILRMAHTDEPRVASVEKRESGNEAPVNQRSSLTLYPDLATPIEMMERQVRQMVRLVDDLLDMSRINRGKIELRTERVDITSVVNHAVGAARPLCEDKGLNLQVTLPQQPVDLIADPIRLAQVVDNLLNNACKFTDRGGTVWLTVEVVESVTKSVEKGEPGHGSPESRGSGGPRGEGLKPVSRHSSLVPGHVTLRVRDTGIGLSADQIPRIFEMFTQVDTSLERSRGGLGIGLTLAKDLVELHGGTLEVHSAGPGQGSEFVVRLPLASDEKRVPIGDKAESGGDATATHSLPLTSGRKRILVVDDNVDSAESLTVLLGLTGNETRTAYDGLEALEEAASFRPDVILLDIGLPELNGYDVARKIREQSWGEKMTLVALTGWGQDEDRRRSKEAGFNHHLTKPVDLAALKKLLADSSELGA